MSPFARLFAIASNNLRHNFLLHLLLAIALLCLTPFIFSINNLELRQAAVPLETIVVLLGIVLLVPLFLPEQDESICAVVRSKQTHTAQVYVLRALYALFSLVVLIGIFALILRSLESEVNWTLYLNTVASALFLGGMGMLAYALSKNIAAAYMLPLLYYVVCISIGTKLGSFNTMAMSMGDMGLKIGQLALGSAFIIVAVIVAGSRRQVADLLGGR